MGFWGFPSKPLYKRTGTKPPSYLLLPTFLHYIHKTMTGTLQRQLLFIYGIFTTIIWPIRKIKTRKVGEASLLLPCKYPWTIIFLTSLRFSQEWQLNTFLKKRTLSQGVAHVSGRRKIHHHNCKGFQSPGRLCSDPANCFNISTMCSFLSKTWKPPLITLNIFLVTILCGEFSSLGHSFRLMFLFCIGFWDVCPPPNLTRALYNECAKGSSLLIIFNYSLILSHQIICLYCQNLRACAYTHNLRQPFLFSHLSLPDPQAVGSNLTLSLNIW